MAKKETLSTIKLVKNAAEIFHNARWANGIVVCPYCGSMHITEKENYHYKCNSCKNRFTDKTNTMLHGSKLPISTWMLGIYYMMIDKGQTSTELSIKLGVNQKTAWLMQVKLRYSLTQDVVRLHGMIAQDEMYIGGSLSNYHYSRKWDLLRKGKFINGDEKRYSKTALFALNSSLKQPVFGMTDGDKVVLYATPNPIKKEYLHMVYGKHVSGDSITVSDESKLYNDWEEITGAKIYTNNHHNNQYITDGGLTSNAIENKFSWFKRPFNGKQTHCSRKYLQLYLNEYSFRYNTRNLTTHECLNIVIGMMEGKHITYQELKDMKPYTMFETTKTYKALKEKKEKEQGIINSLIGYSLIADIEDSNHKHYKE